MDARPTAMDLWKQSDGDTDEYRRLMRKHGYIVAKDCGCEGPCEHQALPCGWPDLFPDVDVDTSDLANLRRRVEAEGRDLPMGDNPHPGGA